jgi:hypothetical protein
LKEVRRRKRRRLILLPKRRNIFTKMSSSEPCLISASTRMAQSVVLRNTASLRSVLVKVFSWPTIRTEFTVATVTLLWSRRMNLRLKENKYENLKIIL